MAQAYRNRSNQKAIQKNWINQGQNRRYSHPVDKTTSSFMVGLFWVLVIGVVIVMATK